MPLIKRINCYTKPSIGDLVKVDGEVCFISRIEKVSPLNWRSEIKKANETQTLMYEIMES